MHGQAEALLPIIDEAMRTAGLTAAELRLVAVTTGPGSFTGIRVGLAAARGIALAGRLELIGVSSFEAAAAAVPPAALAGQLLLVALESRRGELFVQLFNEERRVLSDPAALPPHGLAVLLARWAGPVAIAGDAAERAAEALSARPDLHIAASEAPAGAGALFAAWEGWRRGERGHAQPLYLRPPDVTLAGTGQRAARR